MSCDINLGRCEPCKDSVGGIIAVYFSNYTEGLLESATISAEGEVTAFASPLTFYKYDLKGASKQTKILGRMVLLFGLKVGRLS